MWLYHHDHVNSLVVNFAPSDDPIRCASSLTGERRAVGGAQVDPSETSTLKGDVLSTG